MASVDKMVGSGRITGQEAERMRAAGSPGEVDEVVREISLRHAGTKLNAAVDDDRLTKVEADGFLDRLRAGEPLKSLQAELRGLRS